MPRPAQLIIVLAAALTLLATPALAVVNTVGDVPQAAPGGFGIPFDSPEVDLNDDEIVDWIDPEGNNVFFNDADPNSAFGGAGGLAWNNPLIWVDYETTQNILVGEFGYGLLEINGGTALRYQNLVLGGASRDNGVGDLDLTTTGQNRYDDFFNEFNGNGSRTGVGVMNVTGIGSVFNNDPNLIPGAFVQALAFADPMGGRNSVPDAGFNRETNVGFDVHVGLLGTGQLNVTAGGRVEVQDALFVGSASSAQGDVTVDGLGSYLGVFGRTDFDPGTGGGGVQDPGGIFASYVGGNGRGSLTVSDGGRADFQSGLSIGAANDIAVIIGPSDSLVDPQSSGSVVVTGNGSVLSIAPSTLIQNGASLAIGELRANPTTTERYDAGGGLIDAPDGTQTLGDGSLRVETGSRVSVTGLGSAEVGYNGLVELRGGELNVGGGIVNDGRIDGVGDLRGQTLDTSVYSVIRGGDPNAEPTSPSAEPLRVVLAGGANLNNPTLTQRGVIEGLIDLRVTGDIENGGLLDNNTRVGGRIEAGGQITARSMITNVKSVLIGNSTTGGPLRIRLDSQDQVNVDSSPGGGAAPAFGALQNYGLIGGEIDLITPGGLANGADLSTTSGLAANPPNGGTIAASGTMQVGTFINHRLGLVRVDPGKSLTILTTADPILSPAPGLIVEDGIESTLGSPNGPDGTRDGLTTTAFTLANLGKIVVNGGVFEAGWVQEVRQEVVNDIDHFRLFRNARSYRPGGGAQRLDDLETIGTITATDGTLDFREGVYNTGVMSFDGGSNLVRGLVYNAGFFRAADDGPDMMPGTPDDRPDRFGINYGSGSDEFLRSGVILVSGDGTSVTFQDRVQNTGLISIGPDGNVANFLGDLDNTGGVLQIALTPNTSNFGSISAYISVGGSVNINGGALVVGGTVNVDDPGVIAPALATAPGSIALATAPEDVSITVIQADGQLSEDSLFTSLALPELPEGVYWDVIYDTAAGEVRLELVESAAIGADFNNDNIVDQSDVEIWNRNLGIVSGASIIQGDADLDGDVDLFDYELITAQIFGGGVPVAFSAAVPEPAAALLLCLASVGVACKRRV